MQLYSFIHLLMKGFHLSYSYLLFKKQGEIASILTYQKAKAFSWDLVCKRQSSLGLPGNSWYCEWKENPSSIWRDKQTSYFKKLNLQKKKNMKNVI